MVFKGWAPGEVVGSLTQAACPALRQRLVQPGNMLVGGLSSGAVKQAFYSPLATTIACNISTIRDNRRGVAFRETAYIKGFSSRLRTNPTDPVRSESSGGQKVAGSNHLAPTEIRCSAKTTCGKHADAQKNRTPFPTTNQLVERRGEFDQAIADFNEMIRINPGDAETYYCQSIAYREKGEESKSEADLSKSEELGYEALEILE